MSALPTIAEHIFARAANRPDAPAIIAPDGELSYGQLSAAISRVGRRLSELGVRAGDRVISVASHSAVFPCLCYGIHGVGAVHVPIESRTPAARVAEIASLLGARLIISGERPDRELPWTPPEPLVSGNGEYSFLPPSAGENCSELIFTTGTTGKSKGVMISSLSLASYVNIVNPTFGMNSGSVFLINTPLNHAGGIRRLHMTMAAGGTAVLIPGVRDLKRFFAAIHERKVTGTYLPPASIRLLLTLAPQELGKLNGVLDFIYTASAPFPSADMEVLRTLLPDTRLHQGYGSSETGSVSNYNYNSSDGDIRCLGHPYNGVYVRLTDENGAEITEPGTEGRISVKSPMNMLGYLGEPELTASVCQDGWILTNDLMYRDDRGRLFFSGRADDVINIAGFKIAPTEVESAALRCPGITDCACTMGSGKNGEYLKLLVVSESKPDPKAVVNAMRPFLEPYKLPAAVEWRDSIPRTYNGKIDRKKLKSE